MSARDTALLVVDVQEKLLPLIQGKDRVLWNIRRLMDAAAILTVPVLAAEQYPKGLGATVPELAGSLGTIPEKLSFSCVGCQEVIVRLQTSGLRKVLLAGIETHVCIQQTALDLVAEGYRVYLAVDAVGTRFQLDHDVALRRMDSAGVTLTTTEAAVFEWCAVAGTPQFKQLSQLVRQPGPS